MSSSYAAVVVATVAAGLVYGRGLRRLRATAGRGRVVTAGQAATFFTGLGLVAGALLPPLEPAAAELFSAHMVQHLLLGLIAPLLVVAGRPLAVASWNVDLAARRHLRRWGTRAAMGFRRGTPATALAAVALHAGAFWAWHVPAWYEAAVSNDLVHVAEHATLLGSGLLLWWVVVAARWRERSGLSVLYLFLSALQGGAMAALLTLAPRPLYDIHLGGTTPWGLTALEDQQLAGAIMWVPGGMVYLAAAAVLFVRWLGAGPRHEPHVPSRRPALSSTPAGGG